MSNKKPIILLSEPGLGAVADIEDLVTGIEKETHQGVNFLEISLDDILSDLPGRDVSVNPNLNSFVNKLNEGSPSLLVIDVRGPNDSSKLNSILDMATDKKISDVSIENSSIVILARSQDVASVPMSQLLKFQVFETDPIPSPMISPANISLNKDKQEKPSTSNKLKV